MHSILVYHSIFPQSEAATAQTGISSERFEQQLRWLSRWRCVAPLEETLTMSNRGSVAITFDDGFRDNLTVALPLLEKFQMPMTLFVTAGFVGLAEYLTLPDLREISRHPLVTIGAHGLWHRSFSRLTAEEARFELTESRRILEGMIDRRVDLMAWPCGECNPRLERLSALCGYRASWSIWNGTNSSHSRWRAPIGRNDDMSRFIAKAAGLYGLTKARWHRFLKASDAPERRRITPQSVLAG